MHIPRSLWVVWVLMLVLGVATIISCRVLGTTHPATPVLALLAGCMGWMQLVVIYYES